MIDIKIKDIKISDVNQRGLFGKPDRIVFTNYSLNGENVFFELTIDERQHQQFVENKRLDNILKQNIMDNLNELLIVENGEIFLNEKLLKKVRKDYSKMVEQTKKDMKKL